MPNYYAAEENESGRYATVAGVHYDIKSVDADRMHIPASRVGEITFHDTVEEFLPTMGLLDTEDPDYVAPAPPAEVLASAKAQKKAIIANARYEQEFAGFTDPTSGMFVRTDERTRTLLNAASLRASADPTYEVLNWKTAEGTFITLTNAMILALDQAVRDFIAFQFAKEAALSAQIDAATTDEELATIEW